MITPDDHPEPASDEVVDAAIAGGPRGAAALAGAATAVVLAIWFLFYILVFVPRAGAP
ncbi:MAG TPA: hypothetical protein VG328_21195 [Stellaceae bacterium]|jgi:hypothetical protein|nr:hypothetical protein [Stellaceae bacterium]